jgi:hypothetical protein
MRRFTPRGNAIYEPDGEVLNEFFWNKHKFSCIQGPIGCLSAETEFLTPYGWKRMDSFEDGDRVFVWKDGKAWFEHPHGYIDKPCDEMWWFHNGHSLSMMLSDEHRVALYDRSGRFRVRDAASVASAPGRYTLPVDFEVDGAPFDEWELRLRVAIAADGCLPKRGNQVVVTVRRDRKKSRLRELLFKNRIEFKEHQHSTRPTEVSFAFQREDWMGKTLNLIGCGTERCRVVLDEIRHWDGLYEGEDCRFDGTCLETAEFIQYAAHACGRRATITKKVDPRSPEWAPTYAVHITHEGSPKSKVGIRGDHMEIDRVAAPGGRKYCFTTSTGFFIARHNGRIFVTGNSGTSTCGCHRIWRLACAQEPDYDGVRRTRWIITRRTYKELRETTVKTWLGWFPEDKFGPFIRAEPMFHKLVDPKTGGVRDHPSGDGTKVDCEVVFVAVPDADVAEEICASYEITGFFQNEGQFSEKAVVDELLSRCGRYPSMKDGPGATWFGGWMDMNAPIEGHWVPYMRGDIALPPEMTEDERREFAKPADWEFFVQPPALLEEIVDGKPVYSPNPAAENQKWLIEPYMDKIKGKKRSWIDRRILNKVGLFMEGKPVYPTFSEHDHVLPEPAAYVDGIPVIVGMDFGRDPAAAVLQNIGGKWIMLHEVIGDNESATLFAPRVKRLLGLRCPGASIEFYGDPRGGDGNQANEETAFDVFAKFGMRIYPATSDNNPELRRSTVEGVLEKRGGFGINPGCLVAKRGFAGGYHYRKMKGIGGIYSPKPVKNSYSHIVEAVENGLIGGGEGYATVASPVRQTPRNVKVKRPRVRLSRRRAG